MFPSHAYRPPTEHVFMTYKAWLEKAKETLENNDLNHDFFYFQYGTDQKKTFVDVALRSMLTFTGHGCLQTYLALR